MEKHVMSSSTQRKSFGLSLRSWLAGAGASACGVAITALMLGGATGPVAQAGPGFSNPPIVDGDRETELPEGEGNASPAPAPEDEVFGQPLVAAGEDGPLYSVEVTADGRLEVLSSQDSEPLAQARGFEVLAAFQAQDAVISDGCPIAAEALAVRAPVARSSMFTTETDIVAIRAIASDPQDDRFVWGVLSTVTVTERSARAVTTEAFSAFQPIGEVGSANAVVEAAAAVQAQYAQVQQQPSCFDQCMAQEHQRHFDNLKDCLLAIGIGVGVGANACVLGCLGSGPGYPACVLGCFGICGTAGTAGAGACVAIYTAAMAGAAIGCWWGC
jgi:hypothetical protein